MTLRTALLGVVSSLVLGVLEGESVAQSRKVSPPSRYGPSGRVSDARLSPDGSTVVYRLSADPGSALLAATGAGLRTLVEGEIDFFQFSPDGRFLVYREPGFGEQKLHSLSLDRSSAPQVLTPPSLRVDWGRSIQVSAQGWVVFLGKPEGSEVTNNLYAVPLGGNQPPVQLDGPNQPHRGSWFFQVSPDGAWVGYVAAPESASPYELYVAPVTGATPPRKVSAPLVDGALVQDFRFTPTSEVLVYRANALRLASSSLFGVPVLGSAPAVRLDAGSVGSVQNDFALSQDGEFAFYRHNATQTNLPELFRVPVKGHVPPTRVSAPQVAGGGVRAFALAPDGSAVYRAEQEVDNRNELYLVPSGGAPRRLNAPLDPAQDVTDFQLVPDGEQVLFVVAPERAVHLASLRGAPGPVRLPDGPNGPVDHPFSISASGEYLVFPEVADTPSNLNLGGLFRLRLDGVSTPVELAPAGPEFNVRSFQLELAGERALVFAHTGIETELFAVPLAGGAPPVRINAPLPMNRPLDSVGASALSPDGRWAVFVFGRYGTEEHVYSADLALGTPAVRLSPTLLSGQGTYAWFRVAPDSERVVFRSSARELYSVPIDGSAPALLLDAAPTTDRIQLTPGGDHVLYLDAARRLHTAALDGSHPPVLLPGFEGVGTVTFGRYRISADGTRVVYHFSASSPGGTRLLSAPVDGSAPATLLDPAHAAERLLGVTEGGLVVFQTLSAGGVTLWSVPLAGGAAPIPLATANPYQTPEDDQVAVAGDDVVYVAPFSSLYAVPADGHAAPRALAPDYWLWSDFYFSPTRFYFVGVPTGGGPVDLYSLPRDLSGAPVRLSRGTFHGTFHTAVESADGSHVVYLEHSSDGSPTDLALHATASDGSREPRRLTGPLVVQDYEEERIEPDFALSHDGRTVAYRVQFYHYADEYSTSEVYAVPSSARTPPLQVSTAPRDQRVVVQFHLDPQGRFALYSGDQEVEGLVELYVAPIPCPPSGHTRAR